MSSQDNPKIIHLRGEGLQQEGAAAEVITPGAMVYRANGEFSLYDPTTFGSSAPTFAIEHRANGQTIKQAYEVGDQVLAVVPENGGRVYALLAAGKAVVSGDKLGSNAQGELRTLEGAGEYAYGIAVDSVDNSSGAEAVHIRVDVLSGQSDSAAGYTFAITPATENASAGDTVSFSLTRNGVTVGGELPWTVTGGSDAGTTIDAFGTLTVGASEAQNLTVAVAGKTATVTVA